MRSVCRKFKKIWEWRRKGKRKNKNTGRYNWGRIRRIRTKKDTSNERKKIGKKMEGGTEERWQWGRRRKGGNEEE
jgi:hypothetical protein